VVESVQQRLIRGRRAETEGIPRKTSCVAGAFRLLPAIEIGRILLTQRTEGTAIDEGILVG
jgi:hypothetical protein